METTSCVAGLQRLINSLVTHRTSVDVMGWRTHSRPQRTESSGHTDVEQTLPKLDDVIFATSPEEYRK